MPASGADLKRTASNAAQSDPGRTVSQLSVASLLHRQSVVTRLPSSPLGAEALGNPPLSNTAESPAPAASKTPAVSTTPAPAAAQTIRALPFYIANPNYNPGDPSSPVMIQDPTATATPQAVQWTSPEGFTTTGIMNPFGLTQNNPSIGFYGAPVTRR